MQPARPECFISDHGDAHIEESAARAFQSLGGGLQVAAEPVAMIFALAFHAAGRGLGAARIGEWWPHVIGESKTTGRDED
jgi:hypothetical protein